MGPIEDYASAWHAYQERSTWDDPFAIREAREDLDTARAAVEAEIGRLVGERDALAAIVAVVDDELENVVCLHADRRAGLRAGETLDDCTHFLLTPRAWNRLVAALAAQTAEAEATDGEFDAG